MYQRHKIGKDGEKFVEDYLIKNEYKILEKNFACAQGEIDIIALENETIVIIEIKTRTNKNYGLPSEAVTATKIRHMYQTAKYYLYMRNLLDENIRIDVIEVYITGDEFKINHLKQVI